MLAALLAALALASSEPGDREAITAKLQTIEVPPLAVGERGELSLVLLESPEPELPLAVRIAATALLLSENRLDWSAVVDPGALQPRVRASFRAPSEPGRYIVSAQVEYRVCSGAWCRAKQGSVEWVVDVLAASP
jgi:hypothetical protein